MRKEITLIFAVLLLCACGFAKLADLQIQYQITSTENVDIGLYNLKLKQYELDKFDHKDKTHALAMSAILPGLGHVYAGAYDKAGGFFLSEILLFAGGMIAMSSTNNDMNTDNTSTGVLLWTILGMVKMFEFYNVVYTIDERNSELRQELDI